MAVEDKIRLARQEGYSDREIFGFLKVKGTKEGYSEDEVANFLSTKGLKLEPLPQLGPTGLVKPITRPEIGLEYVSPERIRREAYGEIRPPTTKEQFKQFIKSQEQRPLGLALNFIKGAREVSKVPAKKIRWLGRSMANEISSMQYWKPEEQRTFWGAISRGIPQTMVETAFDVLSLYAEPEVIVTSGALRYFGPKILKTKVGQELLKYGQKDFQEILHAGKVKGAREVAKKMTEVSPQFRAIGEENTFNAVRDMVKKMGGWGKVSKQQIQNTLKSIKEFVIKPITRPTPFKLPAKVVKPTAIKPLERVLPVKEKILPTAPTIEDFIKIRDYGYLKSSDDISGMIKKYGNFTVAVKDVNGNRAIMNASDFNKLKRLKPFTDRIRQVWITREKYRDIGRPKFQSGFMEELQMKKYLEEKLPKEEFIKIKKEIIYLSGVKLINNSTISPTQQNKFVLMIYENKVIKALKDNKIKEIVIEKPYKFGLSEQANIDVKNRILNINADARDPYDSILHELGHQKFTDLSEDVQNRLIKEVKVSKNPLVQGYLKLGRYKEAVAELVYKERGFLDKIASIEKVKPLAEPVELAGEETAPVGLSIKSIIVKDIPEAKKYTRSLMQKRYGDIQEGKLDSFKFTTDLQKDMTTMEREALPFMMEKTLVPKELKRPDLETLVRKPTKAMIKNSQKVRDYLNEAHSYIVENAGEDVNFVEDYITHIWDIPKNRIRGSISWFTKLNPFTKKRFIPTLKAGIEQGLKPKVLDISKIISIYDDYRIKTVANIKFANQMVNLKDENGVKLIQRYDKAPLDWETIDHYAFRKAKYLGAVGEKPMLMKFPVKVHPDIADELKVILDRPYKGGFIRAITTVNSFAKKAQLTFSGFHAIALSETAFATPGMAKHIVKLWNPLKVIDALKNKNYLILEKMDIAKDAVKHRVKFGALADVQRHRVQRNLDALAEKFKHIPVINKATKALKQVNETWDKILWDYYHNSLKLTGYEALVNYYSKNLDTYIKAKKLEGRPKEEIIDKMKDEIGQFVNDSFGGQNFDLLLKSKKWEQIAHALILSPDWVYSTMRQAIAPTGIGAVHPETKFIRKKIGIGFWLRAALYFYGGVNILNRVLTRYMEKERKGKWMWQNDPGHKTHLFIGYNKDGTKRYLRWGKQFRELPEFIINPIQVVGRKLSPAVQQAFVQLSGVTATGFRTEVPDKPIIGRLKELAKMPIPFSIRQMFRTGDFQPLGIGFPISRGMTPYTTRKHFRKAIIGRNDDYVLETAIAAYENNLDAIRLLGSTINEILQDERYRLRRKYRTREFRDIPVEASKKYNEYERKLRLFDHQMLKEIMKMKKKMRK